MAHAQSVAIDPIEARQAFSSIPTSSVSTQSAIILINGQSITPLTPQDEAHPVPMGHTGHLVWSMIALRLADEGILDLDARVSTHAPDLIADDPFEVPEQIKHLLLSNAGFVVPDWYRENGPAPSQDKPHVYMTKARSAGHIPYDDPAGRALLAYILSNITGKSPQDLIQAELLAPLGLGPDAVRIDGANYPAFLAPAVGLYTTEDGLGALATVLATNRLQNGSRYLSRDLFKTFITTPQWFMHPMGRRQTFAGQLETIKGHPALLVGDTTHCRGPLIYAAPNDGIGFVFIPSRQTQQPAICNNNQYKNEARKLLDSVFPGATQKDGQNDANKITSISRLSGIYVRDDSPSLWLGQKYQAVANTALEIKMLGDGSLEVTRQGQEAKRYFTQAPLYFTSEDGQTLIFSVRFSNGYIELDGHIYRYAGFLGNTRTLVKPAAWMLLLLLTAGVYAFSQDGRSWRSLGRFGPIGAVCISTGVYLEATYLPHILYETNADYLIILWRIMLNVGIMLTLSVAFFALSLTRRTPSAQGVLRHLVPLHLILLCAAAFYTVYLTIAWGLAGEIRPY
ncbi:hypothetical protein GCM10017044_02610 [Kordiimonas sediminis]|uniref:Beta-lactamase-related domain-containing protein n=2 Tax=Kordiimonas sediminis TaxID=1735581 RepID=A0A919AKM9_9PROT|nr:hypothetical protein GCM10017044_02610 [Kordiimonas sediminis]